MLSRRALQRNRAQLSKTNVDQEVQPLQILMLFCMKETYYIKQKLTKQKAGINFFPSFLFLLQQHVMDRLLNRAALKANIHFVEESLSKVSTNEPAVLRFLPASV